MSAYFVTASGTDVGKTFASCALLHGARAVGRKVAAYKPVACGSDHALEGDVKALMEASGGKAEPSPWWFKAALSPDMAAAQEGRSIELAPLVEWTRARANGDFTLFEGVGGAMVPLNDRHTVRDWMVGAELPLIVVTGSYLGALNHTLTTLEVLRAAKLRIAALIISESAGGVSLADTERSIRHFARDIPLIIAQPRVSSWKEAAAIHALAEKLA